ncbi:putative polypeptide N-acetylgalactosaminyltransferase 8 [Manis javanica]|nr:putative polypeptide N-acetylgalactosaminyltransferase 8 [Manis javanica]
MPMGVSLWVLGSFKEHVKLATKQQENAENTVERVKDKERPVGEAVEARMRDVQKHKPKEKLFPDSPLFKQLGEDLSEAQQKKAQDLFQKFGYNCYLGNQPLSRVIPDTAEPILARIQEDRTVIVSSVFDNVRFDTFELEKYTLAADGFDWRLWGCYDLLPEAWLDLHDVTTPLKSPSNLGILAANRHLVGETGSLDGGILIYGGENVDLSLRDSKHFPAISWKKPNLGQTAFYKTSQRETGESRGPGDTGVWAANLLLIGRLEQLACDMSLCQQESTLPGKKDNCNLTSHTQVWQCGGRIEILPCSRVAQLERHHKPYAPDLSSALKRSALHVAEIWMHECKHTVHLAWNIPLQMKNSLDESVCLDQGLTSGNTPRMCYCHSHSWQTSLAQQGTFWTSAGYIAFPPGK